MRASNLAALTLTGTVAFLSLYPSVWLICGSLSERIGTCTNLNLDNYKSLFENPLFFSDILNTLEFALGSSILATALSLPVAWIVTRTNTPFKRLFELMAIAPNLMPPVLVAIAWTFLLNPVNGVLNELLRVVLGQEFEGLNILSLPGAIFVEGIVGFPLAFLIISSALKTMDPALEEAAKVSGAGTTKMTFSISFSMILPAILAAWLLRLLQDIEAFEVPGIILVPARVDVLTTFIREFSQVIMPPNNSLAAAAGVVTYAITVATIILYVKMTRRTERFVTITSRGYRPALIDLGRRRYLTASFALVLLSVVFILPLSILILVSLERSRQIPNWDVITHLTLSNYVTIFRGSDLGIIENSAILAIGGATIAMVLSVAIAYLLLRTNVKGRRLVEGLLFLPSAFPGIVLGIGLLWAYILTPLYATLGILMIGYVTRFLPYGVRAASSTIVQIHKDQEDASRIVGASFLGTFAKIVVPLVRPGFIAGWILLASVFMREVSVGILLTGPQNQVIGPYLFYLYEDGLLTELSALAVIVIIVAAAMIAIVQRFGGLPLAKD